MLRELVRLSLRFRVVVVAAAAVLVVVGVWVALRTPLDVFPEFAPPRVEIQVEAPGMSSEAVERLVTIPLENALHGIPQMTALRSKSVQGLSFVQILFEQDTDLFQARQMVTERMAVAQPHLPQQAKAPHLMPPLSSTSRVLHIGLTPKAKDKLRPGEPRLTQTDISVLMKWTIEPRLYAVPGVANISTYGQHDRQYQVLVDPAQLRSYGLTLDQVKQAARQAVVYGSAGFHDTPNQRNAVQYATQVNRPEDLGSTIVTHRKGGPILLGQVATLTTGNPPHIGEGVIGAKVPGGEPWCEAGLFVVVEKYPWANTRDVTIETEKALESLAPALPGVEITTRIFRPASFIERAIGNLEVAMVLGCIFVSLVLIAFLFEWRTALISLTAIPLSLLGGVLAMQGLHWWLASRYGVSLIGGTINTMVLAGLAIAIGEVVDDAIIDVENIVRRLRQNSQSEQPRSAFRVVLDASMEVRSAVVYASLIVVFVCLPIFFMGGVAGSFFRPLAIAYILAVLASLFVALTVTPALCLMLLPGTVLRHAEPPLVRLIRRVYGRLLPLGLNRPRLVLGGLAALFAGTVLALPLLKEEYLPRFQESDFLMHWIAKPGTSIDFMRQDIEKVGREMLAETPVQEFGSHIARAEVGEEIYGPNFAELWISLGDHPNDAPTRRRIEAVMARHPGFKHDLLTYLQERIKEVLTGASASIVMRIYGPDLDGLRQLAREVRQAIEGPQIVPGVVDLQVESQELVPQLELVLDPRKVSAHGLTPVTVMDAVTTLVNGTKVGEVHQQQQIFDLVVWGHPHVRQSWPHLRRLEIDLPGGQGTIPLEAVAELRLVSAPNSIRRDKGSRCIDVTCNASGRDLGSVVRDIQERLKPIQREGYYIEFLGEYQARTENQRQLLGIGILAILGIAALLYIDFRSWRLTLLVLLTLPFALIGGVLAALLTGGVLSLGSLVGFITVLGIAARNGIMLVSHYRHLQVEERMEFGRELIVRGALERVSPILMTALAAGLGLLPLALGGNKPGYEVEYPMAVVILGGLFTSTLLNLLVLPVLYERFGRSAAAIGAEE